MQTRLFPLLKFSGEICRYFILYLEGLLEGFFCISFLELTLGAKYLFCFSSRSLKTREKYIIFAQFVYFLREVCLLFNF